MGMMEGGDVLRVRVGFSPRKRSWEDGGGGIVFVEFHVEDGGFFYGGSNFWRIVLLSLKCVAFGDCFVVGAVGESIGAVVQVVRDIELVAFGASLVAIKKLLF